jgi:homoserine dehydrogenase
LVKPKAPNVYGLRISLDLTTRFLLNSRRFLAEWIDLNVDMTERNVKIGIVGFGTVGTGVAKLILEDADAIAAKTGLRLELACIVDVDTKSPRPVTLPEGFLTDDLDRLLKDDTIKISVETIGGTEVAKDIQIRMLEAGKDVVTANKALLAEHGNELYRVAHQNNRCIAFEASCAGV